MITLDTALGVVEGFVTIAEADVYLETNSDWDSLSDELKQNAIVAGRYYIDGKYNSEVTGDMPDELKFANSLLASDYIASTASFDSSPNVRKKRSKAGTVENEVENVGGGNIAPKSWQQVKSILQSILPTPSGNSFFITRA